MTFIKIFKISSTAELSFCLCICTGIGIVVDMLMCGRVDMLDLVVYLEHMGAMMKKYSIKLYSLLTKQ
jgi:hypothetical protein